jgi:DNA-binding response OmpR family regulator
MDTASCAGATATLWAEKPPMACDHRRQVEIILVASEAGPATDRLVLALREGGHAVRVVRSVGEAELAGRTGRVDAVIAGGDVAAVRRRMNHVPVAAWLPTPSTDLAGRRLELGADEVVHAEMGEGELLARVAALGRRAPREPIAVDLGPLRVDPARGDTSWHGRRLQLTPRERAVLYVLAEARGATVRREVLYRAVWGYAMARGDRTVDVNVKRLRDKLAAAVGPPLRIETEPAVGYRLVVTDAAVTAL